jgi:Putative peptidoglycan binding domain
MRSSVGLVLVFVPFAASAGHLPKFDIRALCASMDQIDDAAANRVANECVENETLAYDELKGRSDTLSEEKLKACATSVSNGRPGSYLALLGCVGQPSDTATASDRPPSLQAVGKQAGAPSEAENSIVAKPDLSIVTNEPRKETTAPTPFHFSHDLSIHSDGPDVKKLQIFLNTHGFPIVADGSGSSGQETEMFGVSTKAALESFQQAHAKELGEEASGRLDAATRKFINAF